MKRAFLAEVLGTAVLVSAVIGSGISAAALSEDPLVVLIANAAATVAALWLLIKVLGPSSGAHFNPAVSLALAIDGTLPRRRFPAYLIAQLLGALAGVVLTHVMFQRELIELASTNRSGVGTAIGEIIATAGLVFVIVALIRGNRADLIASSVALWIGSAYFFTSSTSFANPAVTFARIFSDSFTGIAPESALVFFAMQLVGAIIGLIAARLLIRKLKT